MTAIVIGVFCVVLVPGLIVLSIVTQRRRRARMNDWAARNGWTVITRPDVDWAQRLPGRSRGGLGPMYTTAMDGRPVSVSEHRVSDGEDGTSHYIVSSARLAVAFPPTEIHHRGSISRLAAKAFGPGDTATGNQDFDAAYRIKTADPDALRRWFTPTLIAAQLSGHLPPSWSVGGQDLLAVRSGRLRVEDIPALAAGLLPLADLLDGHPR